MPARNYAKIDTFVVMATEYTYQCTTCSKTFNNQSIIYLCEVCEKQNKVGHAMKGVLKILYPYDKILEKLTQDKDYLEKTDYIDLYQLHLNNYQYLVNLEKNS